MYYQNKSFGNRFSDRMGDMDMIGERQLMSDRRLMEERQLMSDIRMMEERQLMTDRRMMEDRRLMEERQLMKDRRLMEERQLMKDRRLIEERQLMKDRRLMDERHMMSDRRLMEERQLMSDRHMMGDRQMWGRQYSSGDEWKQRSGGMGRGFNSMNKRADSGPPISLMDLNLSKSMDSGPPMSLMDLKLNKRVDSGPPMSLMDLKLNSFRSEYENRFAREPWNQGNWSGSFNRSQNMSFNRGNTMKNDYNKMNTNARMKEILFATAKWDDNPFYCHFCKTDTKNNKVHIEHVRSAAHLTAEKKRKALLNNRTLEAIEDSEKEVQLARMNGRKLNLCTMCYRHYPGTILAHKNTASHKILAYVFRTDCKVCDCQTKNRFLYEKHLVSWRHIRNRIYKLNEEGKTDYDNLEFPEEHDETVDVGNYYVADVKAHFCKICQEYFVSKDISVVDHCKSLKHYENFKAFAEVEVIERAKKKEEKATGKEEEKKDGNKEDEGKKENGDEKKMDEDEEDEEMKE